ncbi:uncharacterized protein LAESUDRAFT_666920 [Laetiporus sulphureus 93-53]|uniref:Uncharacterized protein n=1 Tax=Laetiporus sulphureus 93-53 TaxID=1314785 RepID=A0A165B1R6_9APHY|nr:uncharacterized protein LAESUDRAFT_666920 [Laetiporus sulphureus 93-53]KZT00068.1 hypothetical protein LAESUDRAFT_666920 [Laetiporus sulphureus 93-53]
MKGYYLKSVERLVHTSNGWHLNAFRSSAEQIQSFHVEDMAVAMEELAPELWDLIGCLLSKENSSHGSTDDGQEVLDSEELEYWMALGEDVEFDQQDDEASHTKHQQAILLQRRNALGRIKTVIILSIMMHSLSQHCNALAVVNGIFFHACNTPRKVIKALAHMGISISPNAIDNAVRSLSWCYSFSASWSRDSLRCT